MKAVILAGGYGTRISEETGVRPKPMVEIGGKPILWHIMKIYSHYGINEFIVCCGYKGEVIKDYFANYQLRNADLTFDLAKHSIEVHKNGAENWRVTLLDTGEGSNKSTRIKMAKPFIGNETFCLTYGDGVSDIDINKLIEFHKSKKGVVTMTAVQPPGRFGGFVLKKGQSKVSSFMEKPKGDGAWINGGFFVLEPEVFDLIGEGHFEWEDQILPNLASNGKMFAYVHDKFWQSMDSLRDKNVLEEFWNSGKAPWKVWK